MILLIDHKCLFLYNECVYCMYVCMYVLYVYLVTAPLELQPQLHVLAVNKEMWLYICSQHTSLLSQN